MKAKGLLHHSEGLRSEAALPWFPDHPTPWTPKVFRNCHRPQPIRNTFGVQTLSDGAVSRVASLRARQPFATLRKALGLHTEAKTNTDTLS